MPAMLMRRISRALPMLRSALEIGGGPAGALRRALTLYRREGLAGIRRGLNIAVRHADTAQHAGITQGNYAAWVARHDTLDDIGRAALRGQVAALPDKPLISILMPVYNPRPDWLAAAIASVRAQIYPHWELCIADDASTDPAVRALLQREAAADGRIRVAYRAVNGHISAASNSALDLATGPWVALLDHDDVLPEHALYWVAEAINARPGVRMIYSDEDKLDAQGRRHSPYFKCDWNPELFLGQNMFSHLGAYATELVRAVGGFTVGMEGSQDYDLALRCSERIDTTLIHHIPRVLYHWRSHPDSTAYSINAKPYTRSAALRALQDHVRRLGLRAEVEPQPAGFHARHALPAEPPLITIMIPTRNGLRHLQPCIDSILGKTTYPNYEIVVIDNGSDQPATLDYLREIDDGARIRVLRDPSPFNYSALNNGAVPVARGELLCLLNDDIEVITPGWLNEMAAHAIRPEIGAVGARLLYPDDRIQHAGVVLGLRSVAGHLHCRLPRSEPGYFGRAVLTHAVSAVTGACLLIRKATYQEVGGLNETDLKVAFNDIDFCLKVRNAGYRNVLAAQAELYHHESASRGLDITPEKRARAATEIRYMQQQWGMQLMLDPFYSPNLTLTADDASLAWPPRIHQSSQLGGAQGAMVDLAELAYLHANPDVAAAIERGEIGSGREHYERFGRQEGRWPPFPD